MAKRVLWLIREQYVYESDLSCLHRMGYEVYTVNSSTWQNKCWGYFAPENHGARLTLNDSDRKVLDQLDFVGEMTEDTWDRINTCFDFVFLDYCREQLQQFVEHYRGIIVFRPSEILKGGYAARMMQDYGMPFFHQLEQAGKRFWYAPVFREKADKEANVLSRHLVKLPLLQASLFQMTSEKRAGEQVMIVCPGINVIQGQDAVFRRATDILRKGGHLAYCVSGRQYNNTEYDQNIHGDVSISQFNADLQSSCCILLPENVKGNILYYIVSALRLKKPVVLPKGSPYEKILTSSDCAVSGVYSDEEDAVQIIKRLARGKDGFAEKLSAEQKKAFERAVNVKAGEEGYIQTIRTMENESTGYLRNPLQKRHVGIVLLDRYSQSTLLQLRSLLMRFQAEDSVLREVHFSLGYPEGELIPEKNTDIISKDEKEDEDAEAAITESSGFEQHMAELTAFEKMGVTLRAYVAKEKTKYWLDDMLAMKGYPAANYPVPFYVLDDHNTFFEECDSILIVVNVNAAAAYSPSRIVSSRPFSVYLTNDMILPQMEPSSLWVKAGGLLSQARAVFCQNDSVRRYLTRHMGVKQSKVFTIGTQMATFPEKSASVQGLIPEKYYLLFTAEEKNEERINAFLTEYYLHGGQRSIVIVKYERLRNFSVSIRRLSQFSDCLLNEMDYDRYAYSNEKTEAISLETLGALINNCDFAVLPVYFDMYSQVISWLQEKGKPFFCREPYEKKYLPFTWNEMQFLRYGTTEEILKAVSALEDGSSEAFRGRHNAGQNSSLSEAISYAFPFIHQDDSREASKGGETK